MFNIWIYLILTIIFVGIMNYIKTDNIISKMQLKFLALSPTIVMAFDYNVPMLLKIGLFTYLLADILIEIKFEYGLGVFMLGHIINICGLIYEFKGKCIYNFESTIDIILVLIVISWLIIPFTQVIIPKLENVMKVVTYFYVVCLLELVYILAVIGMTYMPMFIASLGIILFYCSDFELAYNKWVKPIKYDKLLNTILYYSGIFCFAVGIILTNSKFI